MVLFQYPKWSFFSRRRSIKSIERRGFMLSVKLNNIYKELGKTLTEDTPEV